ncbi:MAG: hypothetical protein WCR42_07860 [bacterium]
MKKFFITFTMIFGMCSFFAIGKTNLDFTGQVSLFSNYSPQYPMNFVNIGRYIPQLVFSDTLANSQLIDFEASANITGNASYHLFDNSAYQGNISPYRLWGRYSGKQFEIRIGLQKIDFGSATILRPMQWFNSISPRDPLKITNGVWGALGRYYFLNNANVWAWLLYGNENQRGLDLFDTYKKEPEYGFRWQQPLPKGELALSYHHRTFKTMILPSDPIGTFSEKNPEDRIGLDGKWDLGVGLWFEAVYIMPAKESINYPDQALLNIGLDYTFGIGNGLYVLFEHLITNYTKIPSVFNANNNTTASLISYPLGLDDNISSILAYGWDTKALSVFMNYSHQFEKFMGYVMVTYNSQNTIKVLDIVFENPYKGPGIQLMLVYNH